VQLAKRQATFPMTNSRWGIYRTMFYNYERGSQTHRLEGWKNLSLILKTHPRANGLNRRLSKDLLG